MSDFICQVDTPYLSKALPNRYGDGPTPRGRCQALLAEGAGLRLRVTIGKW